jgi:hypothetical protein
MRDDGNFVMHTSYNSEGKTVWNTATTGHPGAFLSVEDDGNLRIYEGSNAIWAAL